jgi:hypothetical protein
LQSLAQEILAEELGFEVADTGALTMARNLEPLDLVWINLAIVQGWGCGIYPIHRVLARRISQILGLDLNLPAFPLQ